MKRGAKNAWPAAVPADAGYVLVVEDDESVREVVCEVLEDQGIVTVAAENGAAAVAHLRHAPTLPRVVLTDLMMPELDGLDLIRAIRNDARLRAVQVVLMTASPLWSSPRGVALLRKPFDIDELFEALRLCEASLDEAGSR